MNHLKIELLCLIVVSGYVVKLEGFQKNIFWIWVWINYDTFIEIGQELRVLYSWALMKNVSIDHKSPGQTVWISQWVQS